MNQAATTAQLDAVLDCTPIVYEGDPLLLAELGDLVVEQDIRHYVCQVDDPTPVAVKRTILLGPATSYFDRWPVVSAANRAPTNLAQFNRSLFENYEQVRRFVLTQSDIAARIVEDVKNIDVDVIVLLLLDGLSYADWMHHTDVESCLVDGPTITPVGFRNIVGKPPIAHRLFKRGFRKRLGFSYWDRDDDLTDMLFYGFDPATQMFKVSEFKEILMKLDRLASAQTYVQILVNGLDAISHRHRDRPPVEAVAHHLYDSMLLVLVEHLRKLGATALIYATADHGILWKSEPGSDEELVVVPDKRVLSHRCAKGALLVPHSKQFSCYGRTYTALAYPYLFRRLSSTEWGTHGGISFQESVVPFVKLEVS